MQLFELCTAFNPVWSHLPSVQQLVRAIPVTLRTHIKRHLGRTLAHNDFSRSLSPSRQGISLRAYEPGDPLKTLDTRAFLRSGQFFTREQESPATHEVRILMHQHSGLGFSSAQVTKWQLAQVLAGLVSLWHLEWGHKVTLYAIPDLWPIHALEHLCPRNFPHGTLVLISDFMFYENERHNNETGEFYEQAPQALTAWLRTRNLLNFSLIVPRDPCEWTDLRDQAATNRLLTEEGTQLFPNVTEGNNHPHSPNKNPLSSWSGAAYSQNIARQWALWERAHPHVGQVFTHQSDLSDAWSFFTHKGYFYT